MNHDEMEDWRADMASYDDAWQRANWWLGAFLGVILALFAFVVAAAAILVARAVLHIH